MAEIPNEPPEEWLNETPMVGCGHCPERLPLAEIAQHMRDEHGWDVDQDVLEQTFVAARQAVRKMVDGGGYPGVPSAAGFDGPRASESIPMDLMEIWAAIGHRAVGGTWPPGFEVGAALYVMADMFLRAAVSHNEAVDEIHRLEGLVNDMTTEPDEGGEVPDDGTI